MSHKVLINVRNLLGTFRQKLVFFFKEEKEMIPLEVFMG